jgi:SAM-dependent methyltransferase
VKETPPSPIQRSRYQGVKQILAYNRSAFILTWLLCAISTVYLVLGPMQGRWRFLCTFAVFLTFVWSIVALLVSHWVYDLSLLRNPKWVADYIFKPPRKWAILHAGLDENSHALRDLYPDASGSSIDIYDSEEMTEPSIRRARAAVSPMTQTRHAAFDALPFPDSSVDVILLIFAAHELRKSTSRERFFGELQRLLTEDGMLLIVEHLRDLNNLLAFGPGFMHFLPRREWLRLVNRIGLTVAAEQRITPFVTVFQVTRSSKSSRLTTKT